MTKAISLSVVLLFSQTVLSSSSLSSSSVRYKACFAQKNSSQWQEQVLYQCCTTCESICWGVGATGGGFSTSCQIPNPDFGHNEEQAYPVSGSCEPKASASLDELMTQLKKAASALGAATPGNKTLGRSIYSYVFNSYYWSHELKPTKCPEKAAVLKKLPDDRCVAREDVDTATLDRAIDEVCSDKERVSGDYTWSCGKSTNTSVIGADAFAYAFSAVKAATGHPCDWEGVADLAVWAKRPEPPTHPKLEERAELKKEESNVPASKSLRGTKETKDVLVI